MPRTPRTKDVKNAKSAKKTKQEIEQIPVSAPVPKHVDGRPSLAEAKAIAKEGLKAKEMGLEKPGQVANKEPGLEYYYWNALEVEEDRMARLRIMFAQKGYWKCTSDAFVPGVPHAEIWATYKEVYKQLEKANAKRWEEKKRALLGGQ